MPVEKEQEFMIAHIVEPNGTINVGSYEEILAFINGFVEANNDLVIDDAEGFKTAKEIRAAANKTIDLIKRHRIDTIKEYVGTFEERCKNLETILDNFAKGLGKKIKAYDDAQKTVSAATAPKVITATLKFYDEKVVDKLKTFAEKHGCQLTIK